MSKHEYFPGFFYYRCDICNKEIVDWLGNCDHHQCLKCGIDMCENCGKYYSYECIDLHNLLICNNCINNPDKDLESFIKNMAEYDELKDRVSDLEDQLSDYHYRLKQSFREKKE